MPKLPDSMLSLAETEASLEAKAEFGKAARPVAAARKSARLPRGFVALGALLAFHAVATREGLSAGLSDAGSTRLDQTEVEAFAYCSSCHGGALEGGAFGPTLKGAAFAAKWGGRKAELLALVKATMPLGNAGALPEQTYTTAVETIARFNGGLPTIAAGATDAKAAKWHVGPVAAAAHVFRDATFENTIAGQQGKLSQVSPVTTEMLRSPPAQDWLSWRRTQDGAGHSPLGQINRGNIDRLSLKWAWSLPLGMNEIAPIVHDGIMFVNSGAEVQAIDAAQGALLWRYRRALPPQYRGTIQTLQRSFAIFGDKIFLSTADRHVIALETRTGKVAWDSEVVPDSLPGIILSAGPFAAGGVIVQGTSIGPSCKGGCYVVGLDASSGKRLWRFNAVAKAGTAAGASWNGTPDEERTGGASWVAGSYDADLDLYYFGTGSSYGISQLLRPRGGKVTGNDALYTDSTLALRPRTGELVWYHQHLPSDVWDLDEVFERLLVTLPVAGKNRKLVLVTGKLGIIDALDRADGSFAFSKDLGFNNLVTAIDPKTGRRTVDPRLIPAPNQTVSVCPSSEGARNWMATAYNPATHILYLPMQETCMDLTWSDNELMGAARGKNDIGWTLKPSPGSDGQFGRIEAVDMLTGKTVWTWRNRSIPSSSLLSTEGDLLFSGTADRWFRAFDAGTGKIVWQSRLNAAPNSTPISFAVDGKQYIAVAAGGGGPHDSETAEQAPETVAAAPATTLLVFGLN